MNKQEFIDKLAKMSEARTKKESEEFVNDYHALVRDVLKEGGKVQFVNFGTYAISSRAKRKGVNPRTRQAIVIPEKKVPKFTPGKQLKDAVKIVKPVGKGKK
ncbi:MAG: HU family DNA-binding protein [Coprothermobacterota bacterium]|jgi:DNA-binding protein HU-beta|nr:HU family DNA-binding protein [Coprothermobacterota bacterium]